MLSISHAFHSETFSIPIITHATRSMWWPKVSPLLIFFSISPARRTPNLALLERAPFQSATRNLDNLSVLCQFQLVWVEEIIATGASQGRLCLFGADRKCIPIENVPRRIQSVRGSVLVATVPRLGT